MAEPANDGLTANQQPVPAASFVQTSTTTQTGETKALNAPQPGIMQGAGAAVQQTILPRSLGHANPNYKLQCASNNLCKTWKGILETTARVVVMIIAVICFGASAAIINNIDRNSYLQRKLDTSSFENPNNQVEDLQDLIENSTDVAKFMIFTAVAVFIVQIPTLIGRFLLQAGVRMSQILHTLDVIGSIVLAIFFLCGSAPSASYSSQWGEPLDLCDEDNAIFRFNDSLSCEHMRLTWLLAGLAVIAFAGLILMIFLIVWSISAAVTKWDLVNFEHTTVENHGQY